MSELAEALYRHLLSLLPPGRYPREGGAADGVVRALGAEEAHLVEEALALFRQALPQYAEGKPLEEVARGRGLRRFPPEEPDDWLRTRTIGAVAYWLAAGTRPGMERELVRLGFRAEVVEGPFENAFDGEWGFGYGGAFTGTAWAEFVLRVDPQGPFTPRERSLLRHLVRELKPAHAILRRLELWLSAHWRWGLRAPAQTQVWDLGRFGEWRFGEVVRAPLRVHQGLDTWLERREVRVEVFGEVMRSAYECGLGVSSWADHRQMRWEVFDGSLEFAR